MKALGLLKNVFNSSAGLTGIGILLTVGNMIVTKKSDSLAKREEAEEIAKLVVEKLSGKES